MTLESQVLEQDTVEEEAAEFQVVCIDRLVEKGQIQTEETKQVSSGSFWRPGKLFYSITGLYFKQGTLSGKA
jgi:hypothetical protein